jgi:hypothetical protein
MNIRVHAYERAKKRYGINKKSLERIICRIYYKGLKHTDIRGSFRKYIDNKRERNGDKHVVRIYGDFIFIFHARTLITLYHIPRKFKKMRDIFANEKKIILEYR